MHRSAPVGFFDSGRGGECILNAFRELCPLERTVYFADSRHCPYGNKSPGEIRRLSEAAARRLIEKDGCKMVVVACNTATAAAIDHLRTTWPDIPFVGLEPAVKPAALSSRTGVVGVLATQGTFNGRLYNETKARFAKDVTVIATVADEFVTMVEAGEVDGPAVDIAVRHRLEPLLAAGADRIVLGCTHFPHLKPVMERICAGRAVILDPSAAVARQARRVLEARGLLAKRSVLVTGGVVRLGNAIARRFADAGWYVIRSSHRHGAGADVVADLARPHAVEGLMADVRYLLDGEMPDAVVNNAAVYAGVASDDATWQINYHAPVRIAELINGRGRVVNILDAHPERHAGTAYALSKAALAKWTAENPRLAAGVTVSDIADLPPTGRRERAYPVENGAARPTAATIADQVFAACNP